MREVSATDEFSGPEEVHLAARCLERAISFLREAQTEDGTWPVGYCGPSFLLSQMIIASYITKHEFTEHQQRGMKKKLYSAMSEEGTIGLHFDDPRPMMFPTVVAYIALRILGESPDDPRLVRTRRWIHANGGPTHCSSWGKFNLCLMNLYDFHGVAPVPPELYIFPRWFPFHPSKISSFVRMVYQPMAYLYGTKSCVEVGPLVLALREELFEEPFESIDFKKYRNTLYPGDLVVPESLLLRIAIPILYWTESITPKFIRKKALERVYEHICYEDLTTEYTRMAAGNAVGNTLVHHFRGEPERLERSWQELPRYLWEDEDGAIDMGGMTSSKLWDNAFFVRALSETPFFERCLDVVGRAYEYIRDHQFTRRDELPHPDRFFRLPRAGAWTFNEKKSGWAITDCTAEAVQAVLASEPYIDDRIPDDNLRDSVRFLLAYQNKDGGWGSIDRAEGKPWVELMNATQSFGDIMLDHSFVECTSSVLRSLRLLRAKFPGEFDEQSPQNASQLPSSRCVRSR